MEKLLQCCEWCSVSIRQVDRIVRSVIAADFQRVRLGDAPQVERSRNPAEPTIKKTQMGVTDISGHRGGNQPEVLEFSGVAQD
jgi:hypothetical protein